MVGNGDARVFLVVNTTEYNDDGKWAVVSCDFSDLHGLVFGDDDIDRIDVLKVGEVLNDFDFKGVLIIRIA